MDVNNTTQVNSILTILPPIPLGYNNYTNSTSGSQNLTSILSGCYNYTNSTVDYYDYYDYCYYYYYYCYPTFITHVVTCIIIVIGLPLTFVAIYSLYSQVQNDHVAPIYVINLLISDLIQLCCMIYDVAQPERMITYDIYYIIYYYSLLTSVCFMVCIALEKYLLIVFPLWYRYRRTIKSTVVICVVAWNVPALYFLTLFFGGNFFPDIIVLVLLFLPFPLLIFFCCATLKVLSATVSIPPDEKRRIVGTLILVLLTYTLLSLPYIIYIMNIYTHDTSQIIMYYLSRMFARLNPLADLVLYIFMKKGAVDKILGSVCCCTQRVKDKDGSSLENTNSSS